MEKASEEEREQVSLSIQFIPPKKQDNVDLTIWYTSEDGRSMNFIRDMGEFLKPIHRWVNFQAKTMTWSCPHCD